MTTPEIWREKCDGCTRGKSASQRGGVSEAAGQLVGWSAGGLAAGQLVCWSAGQMGQGTSAFWLASQVTSYRYLEHASTSDSGSNSVRPELVEGIFKRQFKTQDRFDKLNANGRTG
jgi:hypothetical protein